MAGRQKTNPRPEEIINLDLYQLWQRLSIILKISIIFEQPDAIRQRAKLTLKTFTSVLAFDIFKMNLILMTRRMIEKRRARTTSTNGIALQKEEEEEKALQLCKLWMLLIK